MKHCVFLITLWLFFCVSAYAAPNNEQLYQMILEMKSDQQRLVKELADAKVRESNLQNQLDKANAEIATAKNLSKAPVPVNKPAFRLKPGYFASAGALVVTPTSSMTSSGSSVFPNSRNYRDMLDYEPGFQLTIGRQAKKNWDYLLKFKRFETDSSFSYPNDVISNLNSAYNAVDFEIGKQLSLAKSITLRLAGGIRFAKLDEQERDLSTTSYPRPIYDYFGSIVGSTMYSYTDVYINKNSFWGLGPKVSISPTWKPFTNNFRLIGNLGVSFLNGTATYSTMQGHTCTGCVPYTYSDSKKVDGLTTMIEAGSGIGYTFKAKHLDIDLQTGYQFEHWIASPTIINGFHGSYGTIGIKF